MPQEEDLEEALIETPFEYTVGNLQIQEMQYPIEETLSETPIILTILLHIFLLSIFEIIFYFTYVSRYENDAILNLADTYIGEISNSCSNLTSTEKLIWNIFLGSFLNATSIFGTASQATQIRRSENENLLNLSVVYSVILLILFLAEILYIWYKGRRIRWRRVFSENLLMLLFLGLYEFLFFRTIVINYRITSAPEIDASLVLAVQDQCGLLEDSS